MSGAGSMRARVRKLLLIAPFVLYMAYSALRHDLRPEHVLLAVVAVVLVFAHDRTRQIFEGLLPLGLVGVLYDAMRPYQQLGLSVERVHLCDLRALELRFFGITVGDQRMTLHDWFFVHHTPAVDLYCAIPYATFVLVTVACGIFLYVKDRPAMFRLAWGFFLLNLLGFTTYHLLPAAPPWYFHSHGCVVDLATHASEGPALMRVDHMLGVAYFHGMYGKAASVFGALPSLHCAYPLLVLLTGWKAFGWKLRAASAFYYVSMVFSAIYLDHHWVIDALLGSSYAALVTALMAIAQRVFVRTPAQRAPELASGLLESET
ncbi:phosphatase PAP2 family protein [Labilithrix luteola]|uniref:phosphatase PAP2 family protein n=1 Tax=Labilithrix luteola TaxID=1391654 RepID=UPI0011BA5F6D|nr:phosphatase PAP2 family protein [Labilithrix luteola]